MSAYAALSKLISKVLIYLHRQCQENRGWYEVILRRVKGAGQSLDEVLGKLNEAATIADHVWHPDQGMEGAEKLLSQSAFFAGAFHQKDAVRQDPPEAKVSLVVG